ncbi:inositol transport system ATP-binding protein [Klebsiella pneumoniae]|nr:inositol transport system ATP-binding protein [Klebsiella pneumoniae]
MERGYCDHDEPTSALTEGEVAHLFTIIRDLRAQGKAIIYISHKMDEIFAITDEISVFRDGTWVGSKKHHRIYPAVADHPDGGPRINPAVSEI